MNPEIVLFDPVVAAAAAAAVAVILLTGALSKWKDLELFRHAVDNYGLLPPALSRGFAATFAGSELLAGVALLPESTRAWGAGLAAGVLLLATLGVISSLQRGRTRIECGCGLGGQRISWGLVGRNGGLFALLALAGAESVPRALGPIDYASVAGATLALLAVYACLNQLLANQPLLKELQS